jgi:hypothetical protein
MRNTMREAAFDVKPGPVSNGMIQGPTPNPMGFGMVEQEAPKASKITIREPMGVGRGLSGALPQPPSGMASDAISPMNSSFSAYNPATGGTNQAYGQVYPNFGIGPTAESFGIDVNGILTVMRSVWNGGAGNGTFKSVNGFIHFFYSRDLGIMTQSSPGVVVSVGSPSVNILYMRYQANSGETIEWGMGVQSTVSTVEPPPTPASSTISTSAPAPVEESTGLTVDQGDYVWNQYAWMYMAASSNDIPSQPPAGSISGQGRWVNTQGLQFDFYPGPGNLQPIQDPYGNTWWIASSSSASANGSDLAGPASWVPPNAASGLMYTPPPALAGTTGQWMYAHPSYYVWIPTAAGLTTGEELALFLLLAGVTGGIAYLLLD